MGFLDALLRYSALLEVAQAARLAYTPVSAAAVNPMLFDTEQVCRDSRYRRLLAAFLLVLGGSRYLTLRTKSADVVKLTILIHLIELGFFFREFKAAEVRTPKMKFILGAMTIIPTTLLLNYRSFRSTDSGKKDGSGGANQASSPK